MHGQGFIVFFGGERMRIKEDKCRTYASHFFSLNSFFSVTLAKIGLPAGK